MNIRFVDRYGNPIDLTNCTEIKVIFQNADGTETILTKTGGAVTIPTPQILGNAQVAISSQVSSVLNIGEYQDFTATLTIGADISTVQFPEALSVFET
jgi:hypothetical protein